MMPPLHTLSDWHQAVHTPEQAQAWLTQWLQHADPNDPAWITLCTPAQLAAQIQHLASLNPAQCPLYGVPFAVKDNIDVAGWPTTAACPAFAYTPSTSATVVQRLQAAGAIVVGKTNLDQFATGLVGTRSPYGAVPNTFDARYVSGGSSSGSASVVARGLVPFALGTDTAGSGRVPAGFNNLVGVKPTPGSVPMQGVLPACRTLDVVSVFALNTADGGRVLSLLQGAEGEPVFHPVQWQAPYLGNGMRPLRVGVPTVPGCDTSLGYDTAFEQALAQLRALGAEVVPVDMDPLHAVAQLLYDGPWVAERYSVVRQLLDAQPQALDPVVKQVVNKAQDFDACQAFEARYRLAELAVTAQDLWQSIDTLMVPTAPTCPTLAAVAAEPVLRNSELGRYTNFVNLLGWSALALPAGMASSGLPFGVTFIAPGGADAALLQWGTQWEQAVPRATGCRLPMTSTSGAPATWPAPPVRAQTTLSLAVVGAHLQGLPLHHQLTERHCRLRASTHTAPHYRLYALPGSVPPKPGLVRVHEQGATLAVEVYDMPLSAVGSFLQGIPYPLGLGQVELANGQWVTGFVCDPAALLGAQDITHHGGWRAYLQHLRSAS